MALFIDTHTDIELDIGSRALRRCRPQMQNGPNTWLQGFCSGLCITSAADEAASFIPCTSLFNTIT